MLISKHHGYNFSAPIHIAAASPKNNSTVELNLDRIITFAIKKKDFNMVSECLRLGANLGRAIRYCKNKMIYNPKKGYEDMLYFLQNEGIILFCEDKEDPTELLKQVFLNAKYFRKKS